MDLARPKIISPNCSLRASTLPTIARDKQYGARIQSLLAVVRFRASLIKVNSPKVDMNTQCIGSNEIRYAKIRSFLLAIPAPPGQAQVSLTV